MKNNAKKIFAIVLALTLSFSLLTACGSSDEDTEVYEDPESYMDSQAAEVAEEPDVSALIAYRDFFLQAQPIPLEGTSVLDWKTEYVRFAELVDFNNDGVPELGTVMGANACTPAHR